MKNFCWVLLNIFTLGIPYIIATQKAKKLANTINNELKVTSKIDFDVDELIKVLGGVDNIVDLSTTISTIKINLKDTSTLSKEQFSSFKNHGFMRNQNQIILIFGDNSQAISQVIQSKLGHQVNGA